ncbi:hypothetical protein RJD24_12895 [Bacillaceae bacterium IKA-2]|nr:hypothetical protein RJD24_12895 [Bacillaceae bacterium IKA-2]
MILTIGIGVLIIYNILSYNKISNLEGTMRMLSNLQSDVQNVNYSVENISQQVDANMNELLKEQLWVPEKGYQITDVNIEENSIDVTLEWSMRDQLHQEQISFLYREESVQEWTELEVSSNSGLNYRLDHTFPLQGNYVTQVIATSEAGKRSEDLLDLRFKEQLDSRIIVYADVHYDGHGDVNVNIDINNHLEHEFMIAKNKNDLKIKSAKAFLYLDGVLLKELNLLKQNQDFHSDSYGESIYYHDYLNLTDEVDNEVDRDVPSVELHVIVEDGLGFKYETIEKPANMN